MNPHAHIPVYLFDGSFHGLLTAVFESYERRHREVQLTEHSHYLPEMFAEAIHIGTDTEKALRVWKGLKGRLSAPRLKEYYSAFLSGLPEVYRQLFRYAHYIFDHPGGHEYNYGHEDVLGVAQIARKVHRETHRMKAFIRFRKTGTGLFFAVIGPDYNVLPLLIRHFTDRYADQPWLIYDEQRKYGVHYDLRTVQEVTIDFRNLHDKTPAPDADALILDEKEALYNLLWQDYFRNTNIEARKNLRLHIQHVPRRYWKYLTEKKNYLADNQ